MTDRYAVIGNPVAHSKSPLIHAAFARETGQMLSYGRLLAPLDGFADEVARFAATGGHGLNVTVPFKLEAFALARECTERARRAGAVNTLKRVGDHWYADNTDGAGLVHDLIENLGVTLGGKHVIVLGAGGAARGILQPILDAHPAAITITNRTMAKAETLAREFSIYGPIRAVAPADLVNVAGEAHHVADVIINATSYGMADRPLGDAPCPSAIFAPTTFAYDLVYALADEPTPFQQIARQGGVSRSADGLGMLIEQAAESFYLWRGVRPSTAHVFPLLRKLAA
jgi:shikimate dehydrogenase